LSGGTSVAYARPHATLTATAVADGVYFSESIGGTDVQDELGQKMDGAFRFRFAGGVRRREWAVEGWIAGDIGTGANAYGGGEPYPPARGCIDYCYDDNYNGSTGLLTVGIDVKYLKPIARNIEVYLRGSISHGELDGDYSGRGLGLGAGVQIKGKVPAVGFLFWPLFFTNWGPKVTAALFIDDGFDFYRLHAGGDRDHGRAIDAQLSHLTIGWAVGSDF
jgi:hypothetical protein